MTRASNSSNPMGIVPMDAASQSGDQNNAGSGGGVFRLDSLAPGVETPQDLAAPTKSRLSMQTLFLVVLVIGGGGLIYGMRLVGIGPLTAIAFAKMPDYDLSKTGSKTADHKKVLEQLTAAAVKAQVPVDQVQKNPFRMADVLSSETKPDDSAGKNAERTRLAQEAKHRKTMSTLSGLKLHGVIGGSNPVARINGQAVRVGDVVAEVFTVKAIHGRAVDLEFEGDVYTLSLDDDDLNTNANGAPKKK
jgi:hypothetical protein